MVCQTPVAAIELSTHSLSFQPSLGTRETLKNTSPNMFDIFTFGASLLSAAPSASVFAVDVPSIRATLGPEFGGLDNKIVTGLAVKLEINDTKSKSGRPLLQLGLNHGLTPTLRYDGDALTASDASGPLPLSYTDDNATDAQRIWRASRDPTGMIQVRFHAEPRKTNSSTPSGPRVDLRDDQGGVVGMGAGFIPYPPAEEDWEVEVHWDIPSSAPAGTRYASSLGDVQDSSAVGHPSTVLSKSYFAVGQLQRWPPWDSNTTAFGPASSRSFSAYWIGTLAYDPDRVSEISKRMFLAISSFFGDNDSPFRVFWRRVWVGYGGTGGYQSFIMEYSDGTPEEQSEEALAFLFSHETIHEYALMFPARQYEMWYREGVAQYYAVMAPFLGGAVDRPYLVRWLNNNAQAYYTGGTTNMTWQSVVDRYWTSLEIVKTPYARGFVYLCQVQGLIERVTNGTKGLDDLVLELYRRYKAHEKVQTDEYIEVLSGLVGKESAEASLASLLNGTLIVPPMEGFAKYGLKMMRKDAGRFEAGYMTSREGKVTGFTERSRAQEAGLQIGDEIVSAWTQWAAGDSLDNMMQVVVKRDGEQVTIKYWPRSYDKVENWQWVDESV